MRNQRGIYNHLDGKKDNRYTVKPEWCGHAGTRFVARFCGEWIDSSISLKTAWEIAQEHYDNHKIDNAI